MSERATIRTIEGQAVLRLERGLRHSPAKVWRAVTEPAELANWFPATVEVELRAGAPMRFTFPDEAVVDGAWDGEVLEADAPRVFMFRWNQDVLRFELIPDGDGCRLVFTHTLGGDWVGRLGAGRTAAGWDTCLAILTAGLDGREPAPPAHWLTPMERYIEEFGLAEGTVTPTEDGFALRFARDLVWKPPAEVWSLLTGGTEPTGEPPAPATNPLVPAGRLRTANAPHELTYEWLHDGRPAGTVSWTIVADETLGVRVEVTQTVPADLADLRATALAGWQARLEQFFAASAGEDRPWPADRAEELVKHYTATL
ncbi:SRPBCC family protein [Actinophytocola sediminis]